MTNHDLAPYLTIALGNLPEIRLMLGATALTAFNDNAAVTSPTTLVPGFTDTLQHLEIEHPKQGLTSMDINCRVNSRKPNPHENGS